MKSYKKCKTIVLVTCALVSLHLMAIEQPVSQSFKLDEEQYQAIVKPHNEAQKAGSRAVEHAEEMFEHLNKLEQSDDEYTQEVEIGAIVKAAEQFKESAFRYIDNSEASIEAVRNARDGLKFKPLDDKRVAENRMHHRSDAADNWERRMSNDTVSGEIEGDLAFWGEITDAWNDAAEQAGGRFNTVDFHSLAEMNIYLQRSEMARLEGQRMVGAVDAVMSYLEALVLAKEGGAITTIDRDLMRQVFRSGMQTLTRFKNKAIPTSTVAKTGRKENPYR